jgi:extradiol dioxygenase family protein
MTGWPRFHLAFPARDPDEARAFYGGLLECNEGRSSAEWAYSGFSGHRIVAHLSAGFGGAEEANRVEGKRIPVRHFGALLASEKARQFAEEAQILAR